jgi:hypothetical protein
MIFFSVVTGDDDDDEDDEDDEDEDVVDDVTRSYTARRIMRYIVCPWLC